MSGHVRKTAGEVKSSEGLDERYRGTIQSRRFGVDPSVRRLRRPVAGRLFRGAGAVVRGFESLCFSAFSVASKIRAN